jgi:esterase/lipase
VIHGVVTDGVDAEYYVLDNTGFKLVIRGGLSDVMGGLLTSFCAQKIPIVTPEELLSIVGI